MTSTKIMFAGATGYISLDETDILRKTASEYDIIVNSTSAFHNKAAVAFVSGLGDRKKQTGKDVHFLHVTGSSNVADMPISGTYHEIRIFSDKEDIFGYDKMRESKTEYRQRTTNVA